MHLDHWPLLHRRQETCASERFCDSLKVSLPGSQSQIQNNLNGLPDLESWLLPSQRAATRLLQPCLSQLACYDTSVAPTYFSKFLSLGCQQRADENLEVHCNRGIVMQTMNESRHGCHMPVVSRVLGYRQKDQEFISGYPESQ